MTETMLRRIIRNILLEDGTHQFHGYKVQGSIEKYGIPGPVFTDSKPVADEDEDAVLLVVVVVTEVGKGFVLFFFFFFFFLLEAAEDFLP